MGTPSSGNLAPITLCASSANVVADCPDFDTLAEGLTASTADYNDYTFTLQVKDNDNNRTCKTVVVRASKNLPPVVTVETNPPAVADSRGNLSVTLVDFDGNGSQTLTLKGKCIDPEGALASCTWSADAGVTFAGLALPGADADPSTLGTTYTATAPVGEQGGRKNIVLTGIDALPLSNQGSATITVRVSTTADDPTENDNPVCQGTSLTTPVNTLLTINPASPLLCVDPENNAILYTPTQPAFGTGQVNGGSNAPAATLIYTPPTDFTGEALFSFMACETSTPELECSNQVGVRVTVGTPCTYALSAAGQTFSASAGNGSVNVTAPGGCAWTAISNNLDWLTITSAGSGSGNETVNFSVTVNSIASQRIGTLTIAGQTFTVTQQGTAPPPSGPPLAPTGVTVAPAGTRMVAVTWTDIAVNETSYEVQRCRLFGTRCSFSNVATGLAANTISYTNTVSSAGTYRFRVRARNASGTSAYGTSGNIVVP
jgi:hypothetical protein